MNGEPDPVWDYGETFGLLNLCLDSLSCLVTKIASQEKANTETNNDIKSSTYRVIQLLLEVQKFYEQEEELRPESEPTQETGT